jgi:hypothetical protein
MHTPRALRVLAVAALSLLISVGTIDPASIASGEGAVTGESCPGNGDVFEFDMPGTYTAFAVDGSGSVVTEVRGAHGQMLATTNLTAPSTAEVDLVSAARFDIASAQVFDVEAGVIITSNTAICPTNSLSSASAPPRSPASTFDLLLNTSSTSQAPA